MKLDRNRSGEARSGHGRPTGFGVAANVRAGANGLDQSTPDRLDGGQRAVGDLQLGEDA
jgi:hypothetical protein